MTVSGDTKLLGFAFWIATISAAISAIGLGLCALLLTHRDALPSPASVAGRSLIYNYNNTSHAIFVFVLLGLSAALVATAHSLQTTNRRESNGQRERSASRGWLIWIKEHPAPTIILTIYTVIMVHESSWFYKEILTWYDDINTKHLLSNFSLRWSFIGETMRNNNYRFFPLSHHDLHILSWLTPYTKVWSLISGLELAITVACASAIVQNSKQGKPAPSLVLIGTLLFLFTSASAYNYFQFIYSERFLTFLIAIYAYQYLRYLQTKRIEHGLYSLLVASYALFFKEPALTLILIPAASIGIAGLLGGIKCYPSWRGLSQKDFFRAYQLELAIGSLFLLFSAAFITLSVLPSLYVNAPSYDNHLRFSKFSIDFRVILLLLYSSVRIWQITRKQSRFCLIDSLNLGAIGYALVLFAMVGFSANSYMALPVHLVAVIDILTIWNNWIGPQLTLLCGKQLTSFAGFGIALVVLGIEDRQAYTFRYRANDITQKQRSWYGTYDAMKRIALKTRKKGEPINIIFSKSWFKHSDYLKQIPHDRIVLFDVDNRTHTIISGINQGKNYSPRSGDFFLDIDTGKRIEQYNVDLGPYRQIYQFKPELQNGRIYRHH